MTGDTSPPTLIRAIARSEGVPVHLSPVDELGRWAGRLPRRRRGFRAPMLPFADQAVYEAIGLTGDDVPSVSLGAAERVHHRPDHERVSFEFASRTIQGHPVIDTVRGELYLLPGRPRAPLAVLIHGNGAPGPGYERWRARELLRHGIHAASVRIAGHMDRRTPEFPLAGLVSSDLHGSVVTFVQAAGDAADLVRWLRVQPFIERVGMAGWSAGGLVSMLAATLVPLDFCVPVVPAADVPWSLHQSRYIPPAVRAEVIAHLPVLADARRAMAAIRPAERMPVADTAIHVIAGARDELCGTEAVRDACARWPAVEMTWVDRGHVGGALTGGKLAVRHIIDFVGAS